MNHKHFPYVFDATREQYLFSLEVPLDQNSTTGICRVSHLFCVHAFMKGGV